jgi:branched-chain amino acid transport system substrate-binding protein
MKTLSVVLLTLATLLMLVVTAASPGFISPHIDVAEALDGSISGTVTDESTSDPLSGIDVCPEGPGGWGRWDYLYACDVTDMFGNYTLGGLPPADYNVYFHDPSGNYASEWYDDKPDAPSGDPVTVTSGADTSDIDAALGPGGSISGTVTNESPGDQLPGIEVCAYHEQLGPGAPWNFMVQCDTTDGTGAYSVIGLRTGNYELVFRDPAGTYGFEWYNDKDSIFSADLVAVTGGADTPGIDAALPLAGSISGIITDESTANPIPEAWACPIGPGPPWEFWPGCVTVDGSGAYSVGGLRPGDYVVEFGEWSGYIPEYYSDRWHSSTADPVSVTGGLDTGGIHGTLIEDVPGLLKIGTLLPFAGALEEFGPELMRGAELATKHLNQGGGVNGLPVVLVVEDSETDPTRGANAAQRLVDSSVDAIVGAVASSVTIPVAEGVTIPNEVLLVSPASTSPGITTLADDDWVFRTTFSDELQAAVLAQVAWDRGFSTACTMYVDNAYGQGISNSFTQAFEALGGTVQVQVPHGDQVSYITELETCTAGSPDVLAAMSYPQHGQVYLDEALDNPLIDKFVFIDGLKYQPMFDDLDAAHPDAFDGMYGTAPGGSVTPEFSSAYEAEYGEPPPLPFIAETYDAVVAIALAAEAAGSTDTTAIRDALRGVVCPPGSLIGAGAADVADGLTLAAAADHLDYEGGTDSQEFDEYGDGSRGMMEIWKTDETAQIVPHGEEPVAAQPDADDDGFDVCAEVYLGTDFLDDCPDDPSDDAWPLDIDMNGDISVTGDVFYYRGRIGATPGAPDWSQRLDLDMSGDISVTGDVFMYRGMIGVTCTNP